MDKAYKSVFLKAVGTCSQTKVWNFLMEWQGMEFCKSDIASDADISRPTLNAIWDLFVKEKYIIYSRKFKGIKLYKLNTNHRIVKAMKVLFNEVLGTDILKMKFIKDIEKK